MNTKQLAEALEAWANLVSMGYEVPAASKAMFEAAEFLKTIDVETDATLKTFRLDLIDQNGTVVGTEYRPIEDINKHYVFVDEHGTSWCQPTAWAYQQACLALNKEKDRRKLLERVVRELFVAGIKDWDGASNEVDRVYEEYIRGDI